MNSMSDFVIKDGVLEKYVGSDGNVIIPNGVKEIGKAAFFCLDTITSIAIPDTVTEIHALAFARCGKMASIILPDSVRSIEEQVFSGCTSLTEIIIPSNVASIGHSTFEVSGLRKAIIQTRLDYLPSAMFCGCKYLEMIELSNTIVEIRRSAFSGCESLKSIVLPENVVSIGDGAFKGCKDLTCITIPDNSEPSRGRISLGRGAFEGCRSLERITLPSGLRVIQAGAFRNCARLSVVDFPNALEEIEHEAFKDCNSLKDVTLPMSLQRIGEFAFMGCSNLESIRLSESVEIDVGAFADCPLKEYSPELKPEQLYYVDAILPKMNKENGRSKTFEWYDSYLTVFEEKSITFHFRTNEKLQDDLLGFLISETADLSFSPGCAASIIIYQSKKWAETAINANYGENATTVVRELIALLNPMEKASKTIGDRILSFVSLNRDRIDKDDIKILYEAMKQKKCATAKGFSTVLGDGWDH